MGKNRIIYLLFSLFIAIMNANAQTCSWSDLAGGNWHAKSGYSLEPLCYWELSFYGKQCRYIYKPKESNSNASIVSKKTDCYLCNSKPLGFDKKQSSEQGNYIAFRQKLTYRRGQNKFVFWYAKIKSINSKVLILEMNNETIRFERN